MFKSQSDQIKYIKENFMEVTDERKDEDHWDIYCDYCQIVRGFEVVKRGYTCQSTIYNSTIDYSSPRTVFFRCPVCKAYKIWIIFRIDLKDKSRWFKVTSIPNEGIEEIDELPKTPQSLRIAFKQAIRSMDGNAYLAAAAMFRRALQIITREILGANPNTLGNELKALVGTEYNGVKIQQDFADKGYIVKEAGNQGAHPDADPDLLDFTQQDARDLQDIFMELVGDVFVYPEIKKKAKVDFLARRKIGKK